MGYVDGRVRFVERIEASAEQLDDLDTSRLVTRVQSGDRDAFAAIYTRYFDRVYGYLRVVLRNPHNAEDAAQQVFADVIEALPSYERRAQPFRAWLFVIVRNRAVRLLSEGNRLEPVESAELERHQEDLAPAGDEESAASSLSWISDSDLMLFIERLPLPQRQVLTLRHLLDLSYRQIGAILDRREDDVRALNYRALRFLEQRLIAVGRGGVAASSRSRRRAGMARCGDKANVLRARRFALRP
jgi:RNA polymerase sigma-70 factor (ECF subfamily)